MIRKTDIVIHLSKEFGFTKDQSCKVIESIMGLMKAELLKGSDVVLPEFVTLSVKKAMGRNVVVPSTGETYSAKEYKKVKARFSKKFRDEIKAS